MDIDPAWLEQDFYETLGVDPQAGQSEITKAYRRLARELHPDANQDPAAEERFKSVSVAYEVLKDPDKRTAYDQARQLAASGTRRRPGGGYTIRVENLGDFGDLGGRGRRGTAFDDFLGFSGPRRTGTRVTRPRPRPGAARRAELTLPFVEAVEGTTRKVTVPGHGATTVRIPAGVEDGQTVRVPGQGAPGSEGGPAGDLLVTVHVEPHQLFGRLGDNLTLTVPVTYAEAVRGGHVTIPTLDGQRVTVRIPPGTPSGRVLRVRGRGVPSRRGRGDLLVTVQVDVPRQLSARQRELIDELAALDEPTALRAHLETGGDHPRSDEFDKGGTR